MTWAAARQACGSGLLIWGAAWALHFGGVAGPTAGSHFQRGKVGFSYSTPWQKCHFLNSREGQGGQNRKDKCLIVSGLSFYISAVSFYW